jgi:hypothetical protein
MYNEKDARNARVASRGALKKKKKRKEKKTHTIAVQSRSDRASIARTSASIIKANSLNIRSSVTRRPNFFFSLASRVAFSVSRMSRVSLTIFDIRRYVYESSNVSLRQSIDALCALTFRESVPLFLSLSSQRSVSVHWIFLFFIASVRHSVQINSLLLISRLHDISSSTSRRVEFPSQSAVR